jgi:hypothetical protein
VNRGRPNRPEPSTRRDEQARAPTRDRGSFDSGGTFLRPRGDEPGNTGSTTSGNGKL